jgi:hypothetical protein
MYKKETTLNIGLDESNHGRYPEIYVAVFSYQDQDLIKSSDKIPKWRRNHKDIFSRIGNRDYSFLLFNDIDHEKINPHYKKLGFILFSLLNEKYLGIPLRIYIDGELYPKSEDFIKEYLCNLSNIDRKNIEIFSGKKYDSKIKLVNIADEIAHYLSFKRTKPLELIFDPHIRYLDYVIE